jgi:hypothetical protein
MSPISAPVDFVTHLSGIAQWWRRGGWSYCSGPVSFPGVLIDMAISSFLKQETDGMI